MTASTKIQWRVQAKKSRYHKWTNKGLFETRAVARHEAKSLRVLHLLDFVRVVCYVKGN
jgi:hypothetical protein